MIVRHTERNKCRKKKEREMSEKGVCMREKEQERNGRKKE